MSLNAFLPLLLALLLVETAVAAPANTAGAAGAAGTGPAAVAAEASATSDARETREASATSDARETREASETSETRAAGRWHEHQLSFTYSGFTTKYSCDGLADKLRMVLRTLGARPDLKVATYGCAALYGGPTEFPRVKLHFATLEPLPAPSETSSSLPTAAAAANGAAVVSADAVAGVWRQVRFDRDRPRAFEAGDCELLEQFRDRVLPLFTIRALSDHTRCLPYQLSGTSLSLSFEVFAPLSSAEAVRPAGR